MPRRALSASLLFSPKELKCFLRFQRQELRLTGCQVGTLPSTSEYCDFLLWREERRMKRNTSEFDPFSLAGEVSAHLKIQSRESNPTIAVAKRCNHLLHPGASAACQNAPKCPLCTVKDQMQYMDALDAECRATRQPASNHPDFEGYHEEVMAAWQDAKLCCAETICLLEDSAMAELEWTKEHATADLPDETMTADKALEEYWTHFDFACAGLSNGSRRSSDPNRSVTFAEETSFSPGRPGPYFDRKSLRYEPGKYTVETLTFEKDMIGVAEEDNTRSMLLGFEDVPPVEDLEEYLTSESSEEGSWNDEDDTDETSWDDEEEVKDLSAGSSGEGAFVVFEND